MMMPAELIYEKRERLLVVCDPGNLKKLLQGRYPQFEIVVSPTYLSGIAQLAEGPVRGIVVGVDANTRKLDKAIAGLRKAAGTSSRVVLCCDPSGEPAARNSVSAGADDYVIYPPRGEELDEALALKTAADAAPMPLDEAASPNWLEITNLAGMLARLNEGPQALLERLCKLLAESMRTRYVRIVSGDYSASIGDLSTDPALIEPILIAGKQEGRILVGPRHRSPFSSLEVEKLRHYSRLVSHLIEAGEHHQDLQRMAMTDTVTELPNRRYLLQSLDAILNEARHNQFCVTLLIFDLDGFKHFNDTYGHAAGDEILRETGQLFRQHCRRHDVVARYAGDEFAVVFWDAERPRVAGSKHPRSVVHVLNRIKKALESHEFPRLGQEAKGHITISGGLASFPWDAQTGELLIERADEALLQAKRDGKNRIYLIGEDANHGSFEDMNSQT